MATNSENFMNLIYDYNCLIERERERYANGNVPLKQYDKHQ